MNPIFEGLNEKQIEAVQVVEGPVLVVSGPGSGKTRCLTHRIAYLIEQGVEPESILAVTFTNKAAGEIRHRVGALVRVERTRQPTIGTFHALGLRILRAHIDRLGYSKSFTIMDMGDQHTLLRRIVTDLGLDAKRYSPGAMAAYISRCKTELAEPSSLTPSAGYERTAASVYGLYQERLSAMNAVDFGDLVMLSVKLLTQYPEITDGYRAQWRYILVDEYQDTSRDQYRFMRLLADGHRNLFCIGDDAQSIYQFRQADIRNILNFQKDYPDAKVIMLEQNYRSTKTILAAAQAVISKNTSQIPKDLWTDNDEGSTIRVIETMSERHEGLMVVQLLRELVAEGRALMGCAVLYRTHAQSRALEEALVRSGTPYRIASGTRFYERKEVKDILAYVRLAHNGADRVSFERIANVPTRGMGEKTVEMALQSVATTMPDALSSIATSEALTTRAKNAVAILSELLHDHRRIATTKNPSALVRHIIVSTHYEEHLKDRKEHDTVPVEDRIENIRELVTVARKYDEQGPEGLAAFLEEVALIQDADQRNSITDSVTLSTIHAAKGLEFPVVIITGMEEGIFPHSRTVYAPHELEEERRLCYVAITRAKDRLIATLAKWRTIFGSRQANIPSRFLYEIPEELLSWEHPEVEDWSPAIDYDA
jgi:DNA helicase-2/ATP-dependent DNA helicase PcrA